MFMWFFLSMVILWAESLFRDYEHYSLILLVFLVLYIFCITMFLRGIKKTTTMQMRYYENKNMEFISDNISKGLGEVTYIIADCNPAGFWQKRRMNLFGVTYICPYVSTFLDSGIVEQEAYARFPATKRQMFQLRLMGCYKTHDREQAVKALEYLGVEWPLP